MAQGAAADSGVTPVMLTPMLTDRLTPAALTPKPVSAGEAVVAMLPAVASSALMRLAVEPTDESWANCDGGLT